MSATQQIAIWLLPILFAITVHEAAHGWVACKLGDTTAQRAGRVTLNPIKHIDPIGTVIVPLLMLIMSNMIFGWAKPVPVNWYHLRRPRRDIALVALAGPGANLLMALLWALVAKFGWLAAQEEFESAIFFLYMGGAGILINVFLMTLNLLPILPLDGGRVFHSLLPASLAKPFGQLEPFGLIILIILLALGMLEKVLLPVALLVFEQLASLVGMREQLLQLLFGVT